MSGSTGGQESAAVADQDSVAHGSDPTDLMTEPGSPGRRAVPPAAGRGNGFIGWLRWGWRRLASMRTALVLLFLLALAAIPGSVFPQRGTDPGEVTAWIADHPRLGPVLSGLGMFDVFAASWFAAIYLLLLISLLGCVIPRSIALVRSLRAPISPPPGRFARFAGSQDLELTYDSDTDPVEVRSQLLTGISSRLRRDRWQVRRDPGDRWLVAEKGRIGEAGNLLFHLSLILLLVGVGLGSAFGWRGTVIVREGTGFANTRAAYDEFHAGRFTGASLPPFRFDLLDFDATFERSGSQRGAPRSFAAELEYQSNPAAPTATRTVRVNEPLRVDGAKVYLLGHGYAPHLRITDTKGRVVFDDTVVFLPRDGNFTSSGVVKAPDASPPLAFEGLFLPTAEVDPVMGPRSSFPAPDDPALFISAWTGDLGLDSGVPQSVFKLDTSKLDQLGIKALRIGQTMELPGGASVQLVGFDRWASFSIAHDPGKLMALAAALATLAGLSLSLVLRRRRIWLRLSEDVGEGRALSLQVAGWQRRESPRLAEELALVVSLVEDAGGAPKAVRPADADLAGLPEMD